MSLISFRTGAKALAVVAGASLALSACASGSSGGSGAQNTTAPITFTYAHEQEFSGYNTNTADGNSIHNTVVINQVVPGFYFYAPNGDVTPNTDFGTYQKTSDSPLTIKYTINSKATWSDGTPVDCRDMVLAWLANSGVSGAKGFDSASTAGYEDMNKPQCSAGDKTVTVSYKKTFADWDTLFGAGVLMPAHIVEKQGGVQDIIAAADTPTSPTLAKAETFYNTAWQLNPGQLKPDVMPSDGPYTISKWTAGQSITLTANPKWWGAKPKSQTIVIRFIAGDQEVQALQNGEIDAMDPQPQVEIVNQLKALGSQVQYKTSDQYTFEHFDYNLQGEFKDRTLREAFTKCIPRQQIVDNLVKPQNPNAQIDESRFYYTFQPQYAQIVDSIGGKAYDQVDIAGAKALMKGRTVTVKVGWLKDPAALNKRRSDTIALLAASCKQAGFNVVDDGTSDFFDKQLPNGTYDVALFAWQGSTALSGNYGLYITGGDSNYGKYSNPKVDADLKSLNSALEQSQKVALVKDLDTQLWTDLYTVPLFAFPGIVAYANDAENVVFNPTQQELTWNAQNWAIKS